MLSRARVVVEGSLEMEEVVERSDLPGGLRSGSRTRFDQTGHRGLLEAWTPE